jgi:MoaA/NifB/PqqE/SkfB family radical SAM enzyme
VGGVYKGDQKGMNLPDALKYKYLTFYDSVKSMKDGIMPPPRMLILYPTNYCPCNCIYCDYAGLNAQERYDMSPYEAIDIIHSFAKLGGRAMELCGGGEPLTSMCAQTAIETAHNHDLSIGILTNGWYLDKINVKLCDYIRITYDAGSPEMYNKIKKVPGVVYEKVLESVRELIEKSNADVSYKYTIANKPDFKDIKKAYLRAYKDGYDSFQLRLARNVKNAFEGTVSGVEAWISNFNPHPALPFIFTHSPKLSVPCICSQLQVVVDYNLDVWTCCYYRHRMETHKLGSLRKKSFEDIWYSDHHWEVIKNINPEECNKYDCRFINANIMWDRMLDEGRIDSV